MVNTDCLIELFAAIDAQPFDEQRLRRLAYVTFDGDALELMTTLLGMIRGLADQLAPFYGITAEAVLRMEAVLPIAPQPTRAVDPIKQGRAARRPTTRTCRRPRSPRRAAFRSRGRARRGRLACLA